MRRPTHVSVADGGIIFRFTDLRKHQRVARHHHRLANGKRMVQAAGHEEGRPDKE